MEFRTGNVEDFVGWRGETPDALAAVGRLIDSGQTRSDWLHTAYDNGEPIMRVGYRLNNTVSTPSRLGTLPSHEFFAIGIDGADHPDFLSFMAATLPRELPDQVTELENRLYESRYPDAEHRAQALRDLGFWEFKQKHGFRWSGAIQGPIRDGITFVDAEVLGAEEFTRMVGTVVEGGLDREMNYYRSHMTHETWAAEMMHYLGDNQKLHITAFVDGEPIGFVSLTDYEPPAEATIGYIGVVPTQRGRGYSDDLIRHGTNAAVEAGYTSIFSETDTRNTPMAEAFIRNGHEHVPGTRLWSHRISLATIREHPPSEVQNRAR